jgi:NADPH:quinone reductase-like Zn-dependent oxidoreductase
VIDVAAHPDWATVARSLTHGRGIDRIVEVGGAGTLEQSIKAVAYHGQVSLIGALSGDQHDAPIDFKQLFLSQARYECIGVGSRSDLEELIRTMTNHALRPVVDSIFAFDEFDKALEHFSGRNVFGKVIIRHGTD